MPLFLTLTTTTKIVHRNAPSLFSFSAKRHTLTCGCVCASLLLSYSINKVQRKNYCFSKLSGIHAEKQKTRKRKKYVKTEQKQKI